jgi:hypothetical protein
MESWVNKTETANRPRWMNRKTSPKFRGVHPSACTRWRIRFVRGSFQISAHCVFSLKMNLFYKIHLQAFNVISIVLYHSGPTFGQVLYSCLDAFVVDASDYSDHLIRHILNASEAFPTEWFFNFGNKSKSGVLTHPPWHSRSQTGQCKVGWRVKKLCDT